MAFNRLQMTGEAIKIKGEWKVCLWLLKFWPFHNLLRYDGTLC